jgi:hypothetical protein
MVGSGFKYKRLDRSNSRGKAHSQPKYLSLSAGLMFALLPHEIGALVAEAGERVSTALLKRVFVRLSIDVTPARRPHPSLEGQGSTPDPECCK